MNIKVIETNERTELINFASGMNWIQDLIGNANAFDDGQFVWSEEDDAYLATQDTFDWWMKYISDTNATIEDVNSLADELDIDADIIWDRIDHYSDGDYGTHRNRAIQAMNEIREQYTEQS